MAASDVSMGIGTYSSGGVDRMGIYLKYQGKKYALPMNYAPGVLVPRLSGAFLSPNVGDIAAWPYASFGSFNRAVYIYDSNDGGWWPVIMTGHTAPAGTKLPPGGIAAGVNSAGMPRLYMGAYDNLNTVVYDWYVDATGVV